MNADERAALQALLAEATPLPWRAGDIREAPVHPGIGLNGEDECAWCSEGEPIWTGDRDGQLTHRHAVGAEHHINGPADEAVSGNYDYEDGGIIRAEDTLFIVAAANALPELLEQNTQLETAVPCEHVAGDNGMCFECGAAIVEILPSGYTLSDDEIDAAILAVSPYVVSPVAEFSVDPEARDRARSLFDAIAEKMRLGVDRRIARLEQERDAWRNTATLAGFHTGAGLCPDIGTGPHSRDPLCPGCAALDGQPPPDRTPCQYQHDDIYCAELAAEHGTDGCGEPGCACPLTPQQVHERWAD